MIIIIVVVFVVSSLGLSGLVIWDATRSKDSSADVQKQIEELQEQQNASAGKPLEGYEPLAKVEKLEIIEQKVGSGKEVKKSSTVTVHYTGALARDGKIFESSQDSGQPITFPLSQVIKGWQEGLPGMREGGKRRILIPANLAYGQSGSPPSIGPNEPLVFDIELVSVK
jgi:FKBP-type peptidyl-prolyl cis-trans isomerase